VAVLPCSADVKDNEVEFMLDVRGLYDISLLVGVASVDSIAQVKAKIYRFAPAQLCLFALYFLVALWPSRASSAGLPSFEFSKNAKPPSPLPPPPSEASAPAFAAGFAPS